MLEKCLNVTDNLIWFTFAFGGEQFHLMLILNLFLLLAFLKPEIYYVQGRQSVCGYTSKLTNCSRVFSLFQRHIITKSCCCCCCFVVVVVVVVVDTDQI